MATGQAGVVEQMRRLFGGRAVSGLGERELLDRFARSGDATAFEAILARHGPMVLGVCPRRLADTHDVDAAFQATFLVLVRRARGLNVGDRLGPWLFGVADRVARRAWRQASRRPRPLDLGLNDLPDGRTPRPDDSGPD